MNGPATVPSTAVRPTPLRNPDSAPFWAACERGELLGQRCGACATWRWPAREHCPLCHAAEPVWQPLPGTGRIVGLVVVRRALDPAFAAEIPLAVVHVELDDTEGQMVLTSNLQPGEDEAAAVGSVVAVRFCHTPDGPVLPTFTLTDHPEEEPHHVRPD